MRPGLIKSTLFPLGRTWGVKYREVSCSTRNTCFLKKESPSFQSTNFNLFKTSFKKHLYLLLIYIYAFVYIHVYVHIYVHIYTFFFFSCCHVTIASSMLGIRAASPLGSLPLVALALTHLFHLRQVDLP